MRISDWSSDVCSSDLGSTPAVPPAGPMLGDGIPLPFLDEPPTVPASQVTAPAAPPAPVTSARRDPEPPGVQPSESDVPSVRPRDVVPEPQTVEAARSEEHTSELQSLMRISYAVFGLKQKKNNQYNRTPH